MVRYLAGNRARLGRDLAFSAMSYLTHRDGTRFYYKDLGSGPVVLLAHSWALDSSIWEYQIPALVAAGYRCVAMDRRGHGRTDEPGTGYDLDTLADDLAALLDHLDLTEVSVLAHSMACTEVTRYLSRHGSARVTRAAYLAPVTPCLRLAVGDAAYEGVLAELASDRPAWFSAGQAAYFGLPGSGVSRALADETLNVIQRAPLEVLLACQRAGTGTDVSAELATLDIPVLVLHGDVDASAPVELTGRPTADAVPDGRLVVYPGAPHGLYVTHRERLNKDLLDWLAG